MRLHALVADEEHARRAAGALLVRDERVEPHAASTFARPVNVAGSRAASAS